MDQKDNKIKNIVLQLQNRFGSEHIVIQDYWEADNCAIGLTFKNNKNVVYISSWGKKNNEFFVSIECPDANGKYRECDKYDTIRKEKVIELIEQFIITT